MPGNPTLPEDVREEAAKAAFFQDDLGGHIKGPWTWQMIPEEGRRNYRALIDAIAPLIIEWARKDQPLDYRTGGLVARFSSWIDASYPKGMDAELVLRRRIDKLMEEVGEVGQALGGLVGENPRKGITHTREQVMGELLDVAFTALGAWEHMDGNRGRSTGALEEKAVFVLGRVNMLPTPDETTGGE